MEKTLEQWSYIFNQQFPKELYDATDEEIKKEVEKIAERNVEYPENYEGDLEVTNIQRRIYGLRMAAEKKRKAKNRRKKRLRRRVCVFLNDDTTWSASNFHVKYYSRTRLCPKQISRREAIVPEEKE